MYIAVNETNIPSSLLGDGLVIGGRSVLYGIEEKSVHYLQIENVFCILIGTIYDKTITSVEHIYRKYQSDGYRAVSNIDGDFVYIEVRNDGTCIAITDHEGDIPLYYRVIQKGLLLSTYCSDLFYDFSINSLNERSVNDFLRFGTLIGDETMHKDVFLLQGGSELTFCPDKGVYKIRHYKFHYQEEMRPIEEVAESVFKAYSYSVKKRIEGKEKDTCIFLSGGMDSRLLLGVANQVSPLNKVSTVSFGQKHSEEVDVARSCARVLGNEFKWVELTPKDFIKNASLYLKMTCGGDMFPQSYIISAAQAIGKSAFVTGFALDAYMGGTFLSDDAIKSDQNLDDFLKDHLGLLKMNVFSKDELLQLTKEGIKTPFLFGNETILEEAKRWHGISVKDCIQAFAIDNRAKRCVALREITPGYYMQRVNPSSDIEFLKAVSSIPAEYRINHRFYHGMFLKYVSEYANIPYNNTTLPVSAPVEMWKKGSANEAIREKLYAEFMAEYNKIHEEKLYYPHYYSDFDGYSRYDVDWMKLFNDNLLNPDAVIVNLWFDKSKIAELYQDHIQGRKNNRKKLIFLTSLEIFLKNNLIN